MFVLSPLFERFKMFLYIFNWALKYYEYEKLQPTGLIKNSLLETPWHMATLSKVNFYFLKCYVISLESSDETSDITYFLHLIFFLIQSGKRGN